MEMGLDITPDDLPDYYLVLAGPKSPAISSRGQTRPWLISFVFLFQSGELISKLSGVKIGIATSVKSKYWDEAEIYPIQYNTQLIITPEKRELLAFFG